VKRQIASAWETSRVVCLLGAVAERVNRAWGDSSLARLLAGYEAAVARSALGRSITHCLAILEDAAPAITHAVLRRMRSAAYCLGAKLRGLAAWLALGYVVGAVVAMGRAAEEATAEGLAGLLVAVLLGLYSYWPSLARGSWLVSAIRTWAGEWDN